MRLSIGDKSPGFSVLIAAFDGLALVVIFLTFSERDYNFNEFPLVNNLVGTIVIPCFWLL